MLKSSKTIQKEIYRRILNNIDKVGIAIVFLEEKESETIYQFKNNTYVTSEIESVSWSEIQYISELTWEECTKITNNIYFKDVNLLTEWIEYERNNCFNFIKKKIHNIFFRRKK
ncbi:hypothetical protein GW796_00585 [archaeon]|nr:hypothetical protein [archaeon]NCQ50401.1 hypothetical protein [archaeon]